MKKLLILISSILIFHIQTSLGYEQIEDLSLQIKKEKLFFNDQYRGYIFELKNISDKPILIEEIEVENTITKENIQNNYNNTDKASELCLSMIGFGIGEEPLKTPIIFAPVGIVSLPFAIIHDGIRPLVDESVLSDVIIKCKKYGNAVSSLPYNEQIFIIDDEYSTTKYIPRETLRRVSTPQAYKYGLLYEKYKEAFEKKVGIYGSSYTNTMMVDLGVKLYFAAGSDKNIKLTTKDDLEIFKGYLRSKKGN